MLSFVELKPTQKMYVIEVMHRFNHNDETIDLTQIKDYHKMMVNAREDGCPKLGYPNWLIVSENKVSKAIYGFPVPTESEMEDYLSGNVEAVIDLSKFSPLLNNVIKEYGLKP
jgi:hypothetical protein